MAELGTLADEKNIEISLEGPEYAKVIADEVLLRLMLGNIIENAIKYTPVAGQVRINLSPLNDAWKIEIIDTGSGIPKPERTAVFKRFYRIGTPQTEGSGLGLAIVAEIIKRFSGSIELKNPHYGTGLLVEIILPKK